MKKVFIIISGLFQKLFGSVNSEKEVCINKKDTSVKIKVSNIKDKIALIEARISSVQAEMDTWKSSYGTNKTYMRTTAYHVFVARLNELKLCLKILKGEE